MTAFEVTADVLLSIKMWNLMHVYTCFGVSTPRKKWSKKPEKFNPNFILSITLVSRWREEAHWQTTESRTGTRWARVLRLPRT